MTSDNTSNWGPREGLPKLPPTESKSWSGLAANQTTLAPERRIKTFCHRAPALYESRLGRTAVSIPLDPLPPSIVEEPDSAFIAFSARVAPQELVSAPSMSLKPVINPSFQVGPSPLAHKSARFRLLPQQRIAVVAEIA
jgi:hypothetical protein